MTLSEQSAALREILRSGTLSTLFQPILAAGSRQTIGYEALSRGPSNSPLHSPMTLFTVARHSGQLLELDMLCRRRAIERFASSKLPGKLFLNILPETLLDHQHSSGRTLQMLQREGLTPERVVIELTEQSPIDDYQLLQRALHHYRSMGFSIALDDLGAGYSGLRLWTEMRPEYVKIDRYFIDGIHLDPLKREFVGSILRMAKASCARVVAEGIELQEELEVLEQLGAEMLQGFWLGRPQPWSTLAAVNSRHFEVTHSYCG